jgi:hypothetical protein
MSWETALGGAFGSILGYIGQEETNDTNVMLAREARHSAENMSNTAYQRATADMRAAGLNPALMFGKGQAASSPVTQAPRVDNELGAAASSAVQIAQAVSNLRQADALIDKTSAETQNVKAQTVTEMVKPDNVKAMTTMFGANAAKAVAEEALTREQTPTIRPLAAARIAADQSTAFANYGHGSRAYEGAGRERVEADLGRQTYRNRNEFGQGILGDEANSVDALVRRFLNGLGLVSPRGQ